MGVIWKPGSFKDSERENIVNLGDGLESESVLSGSALSFPRTSLSNHCSTQEP